MSKKTNTPTTVKKVTKPIAKKSVTKKTVVKKVTKTPKKTLSKKTTKKDLVYCEDVQSFWVNDGQILNSLAALHKALEDMEKDIFAHHVNNEKNDFATWVEVVLCDGECADDLRKVRDVKKAVAVTEKHLKSYNI